MKSTRPSALNSWLDSYVWFQEQVSHTILESNISDLIIFQDQIYFFKDARNLHSYKFTCPSKENMGVLHQKKFEKFQLLRSSIKSNGGSVYLFAVEVGAGGYCFTTVRCCLSGLGVSGNFMNSTLKLILSSLKTSLQIWLSKDYKRWTWEKSEYPS